MKEKAKEDLKVQNEFLLATVKQHKKELSEAKDEIERLKDEKIVYEDSYTHWTEKYYKSQKELDQAKEVIEKIEKGLNYVRLNMTTPHTREKAERKIEELLNQKK